MLHVSRYIPHINKGTYTSGWDGTIKMVKLSLSTPRRNIGGEDV
jgi:hypothetical protein